MVRAEIALPATEVDKIPCLLKADFHVPGFSKLMSNESAVASKVDDIPCMASFFPFELQSESLISTDKIILQAVNRS